MNTEKYTDNRLSLGENRKDEKISCENRNHQRAGRVLRQGVTAGRKQFVGGVTVVVLDPQEYRELERVTAVTTAFPLFIQVQHSQAQVSCLAFFSVALCSLRGRLNRFPSGLGFATSLLDIEECDA
jgi:hypothetical protein